MTSIEPPYRLVKMDERDWQFRESPEMEAATREFDRLWQGSIDKLFAKAIRQFLRKHPDHIDGLHHYSMVLSYSGRRTDALAYSYAAVGTGMRAFPKEFDITRDRLDTGYVYNRPFIRALHGLMTNQYLAGLIPDAIATGRSVLSLDPCDRNGARLDMPVYMLHLGHDTAAVHLFEKPEYHDTFFTAEYVHALALFRLNRIEEARKVLRERLYYHPQVARFILHPEQPRPEDDGGFGVASGGELEGWLAARDFGDLWRGNAGAMDLLQAESAPHAKAGWKRYLDVPPAGPEAARYPGEGE